MSTVTVPVIHSNQDLQLAIDRIERLWGAPLNTPDGDELQTLMVLVEAFEREHFPILSPTPRQAIKGLMDRLDLSQRDLVPCFGSPARVSEFLSGKRPLSKGQIVALHKTYRIPYDILLGDEE